MKEMVMKSPPHIKKLETYFALLYFWTFAQYLADNKMGKQILTGKI